MLAHALDELARERPQVTTSSPDVGGAAFMSALTHHHR
jgi:hypothetical protein